MCKKNLVFPMTIKNNEFSNLKIKNLTLLTIRNIHSIKVKESDVNSQTFQSQSK